MSGIFSSPKVPQPRPTPRVSDAEVQARATKDRIRAAQAKGRSSTILGSQTGRGPQSGQVRVKTLLGEGA